MGEAPELIARLKGPVFNAARDLIACYFGDKKVLASIPARPDHDADLVLTQGLMDAIAALEQSQAAIASARAQALEEAAGVVEGKVRGARVHQRDEVCSSIRFEFKLQADALQEAAAAIRALSDRPDTTAAVIEAAKAVVRGLGVDRDILGGDPDPLVERLAAALAAHEARHG